MPRPPRADETGAVYHALISGNARQPVFHPDEAFTAFERVIGEGLKEYSVQLYSYQCAPGTWFSVAQLDGEMSRFLYWRYDDAYCPVSSHYHTPGEDTSTKGGTKVFQLKKTIIF